MIHPERFNKCIECLNDFPIIKFIDGVKKIFTNRRKCFDCLPYEANPIKPGGPAKFKPINPLNKICPKCLIEKPKTTEFFPFIKTTQTFNSYCIECENTRTREHCQKRKQMAIDYKGGACLLCNYKKCNSALDFHHLDPSKKEFNIARRLGLSFDKLKLELDKCILLCGNCHSEVESGMIIIPPELLNSNYIPPIFYDI